MEHRTKTTGCGSGTVSGDLIWISTTFLVRRAAQTNTLYALSNCAQTQTIYKPVRCTAVPCLVSPELYFVKTWTAQRVDAIAGDMARRRNRRRQFLHDRTTHERMVIKAAQMGVPFLVSRSGLRRW